MINTDAAATAAAVAAAAAAIETTTTTTKPPKKRKVTSKAAKGGKTAKKPKAAAATATDDANKKTQVRYDPEVPMDKEQLAAWRREARRVRNRESAAASRQRIRDRIGELETEVGQWKSKYAEAMERLHELEQLAQQQGGGAEQV